MSEHYDFHYQPTGSGAISGQQVLQQTEDAINELGDYVNDNVGGAMDVAQQALETAQTAETNAQTALDTANSFSSAIQSAQQDASTALSTAQTAQTTASNANNTAIQAQQDASSAVTTANNASGQVNTLSGTVTTLGQRVTTAEGNIGQNTSDITALTTRVGTAEGNITTLQNDVSIAQGNASSAMATAGQVKQQAFVFRYSSTALVASSTNSNTLLDNTDNLKVGDKVIDSSGVLFSITAIDTANSTFTVGSALVDLALDANVVHTSGNETVDGNKTFVNGTTLNDWLYFTDTSVTKGTIPQSTVNPYRIYFGSGINYANSLFNIDTSVSNAGVQILTLRSAENVVNGDDTRLRIIYDPTLTQPKCVKFQGDCLPSVNNTYECGNNDLKWKSINGINPGALSLPDLSNGIDISSYITAGNTHNEYTPTVDGWISVIIKKTVTSGALAIFLYQGDMSDSYFGNTSLPNETEHCGMASIPVKAGAVVNIDLKGSNTYVYSAKFYPCQGNV